MSDAALPFTQAGVESMGKNLEAEDSANAERSSRVAHAGLFLTKTVARVVRNWTRQQVLRHEAEKLIRQDVLPRFPTGTKRASLEVNVSDSGVRVATLGEDNVTHANLYYKHAHDGQKTRVLLLLEQPGEEKKMITDSDADAMTVPGIHHAISLLRTRVAMSRHPATYPEEPH